MIIINNIGCGKLGKTLLYLLCKHHDYQLNIVNSTIESAKNAVKFINQGIAYENIQALPAADIYFITTGDDLIKSICDKLILENKLKAGDILVHCSGSLSSDILNSAKALGCFVASVHPIKSFADPKDAITNFKGTYCAIEGDDEALNRLTRMFEEIEGIIFRINKEHKGLYHAAGVFANNYLVTLHNEACKLYIRAGIDDNTSKQIVTLLMLGGLNNLANKPHQGALTGPIQRGDSQVVKKHLEALESYPLIKKLYKTFGLLTISLTNHAKDKKAELESYLYNKK